MQHDKWPGNWYIMDKGSVNESEKKYIARPYETKERANIEKLILLKYFAADSMWHKRLFIKKIVKEVKKERAILEDFVSAPMSEFKEAKL